MAIPMSVCRIIHDRFNALPKFSGSYEVSTVPENGIYVVFEKGESAHGGDRIVRVGTHTGERNLRARLNEHLYRPNKDRSIFRKHIGRCILKRRGDGFYDQWEIDLTTRANREKYGRVVDLARLQAVEAEVTSYITTNLLFTVVEVPADRATLESKLLSTIAQCPHCGPSKNWLGRYHPNQKIAISGLWNIQGMRGQHLSMAEAGGFC
jgi:hypothetical protein